MKHETTRGVTHSVVDELLCLTTSYPHEEQMSAGCFVRRLNQITQQALSPTAGDESELEPKLNVKLKPKLKPNLNVVTMWRGSTLPSDEGDRESIRYVQSLGGMFARGAPDWVSAHPVAKLFAMPINGIRLRAEYHRARRSLKDEALVLAHWAIPCGWIARAQSPIVYCHGGDVALLESISGGRAMARAISAHARAVVCVSEDLTERWRALTQHKINEREGGTCGVSAPVFTVPMGIEAPHPSPRAYERWRSLIGDRLCIATVGRLDEIKGYDLLVEAIGALEPKLRSNICWLAAGTGPERDRLNTRAAELDVPLIMLGELNPAERDALLAIAPLFIAPSRQVGHRVEGAPLALREAALSGCLIIATSLGGVPELARALNDGAEETGGVPSVSLCAPTVESLTESLTESLADAFADAFTTGKTGVRDLVRTGVRDLVRTGVRDLISSQRAQISARAHALWSWDALAPQHIEVIRSVIAQ